MTKPPIAWFIKSTLNIVSDNYSKVLIAVEKGDL